MLLAKAHGEFRNKKSTICNLRLMEKKNPSDSFDSNPRPPGAGSQPCQTSLGRSSAKEGGGSGTGASSEASMTSRMVIPRGDIGESGASKKRKG